MSDITDWFALATRAKDLAAQFSALKIPVGSGGLSRSHRVAYALIARTASNFIGLVILCRAGRVVEARTLARLCMENSFYLNRLVKDGDPFVEKMREANIKARQARGQFMLDRPDMLIHEEVRENLKAFLRESRAEHPKPGSLNPKGVALKTEYEHLYLAYDAFSDDSSACIWLFSSIDSTTAWAGGST